MIYGFQASFIPINKCLQTLNSSQGHALLLRFILEPEQKEEKEHKEEKEQKEEKQANSTFYNERVGGHRRCQRQDFAVYETPTAFVSKFLGSKLAQSGCMKPQR